MEILYLTLFLLTHSGYPDRVSRNEVNSLRFSYSNNLDGISQNLEHLLFITNSDLSAFNFVSAIAVGISRKALSET